MRDATALRKPCILDGVRLSGKLSSLCNGGEEASIALLILGSFLL